MGVYDYIKPTKSSSKTQRDFYTVVQPLTTDAGASTTDMLTNQVATQAYPDAVCPASNTFDTVMNIYNNNQYAASVTSLLQGRTDDQKSLIAANVVTYSGYVLPTFVPIGLRTENIVSKNTNLDGIDFWWEKGVQT